MLSSSCPALSGSNQFSTVPACCHFKRKFPSTIFCGMCSSKCKPLGIFHLAICNQLSKVLVLNLSRLAWIQFLLTGILTLLYWATHTTLVFIVLLMCCFVVRDMLHMVASLGFRILGSILTTILNSPSVSTLL
jgi:hypothetical protein